MAQVSRPLIPATENLAEASEGSGRWTQTQVHPASLGTVLALPRQAIAGTALAGGRGQVSSGSFTFRATVGQALTGRVTTGGTELCSGYWCTGIRYEVFLPLVIRD